MTREDWMNDFRRVDEIAIASGRELQACDEAGKTDTALLRMLYWIAVAVWHLLDSKIRGLDSER